MTSYVVRESIEVFNRGSVYLVDEIIVEQQPKPVRLDDADVMASVRVGAAMDDHRCEIIHSVWVDGIVGLKIIETIKQSEGCHLITCN